MTRTGRGKGLSVDCHAKWQTPWDLGGRYLELSIERWVDKNGQPGWNPDADDSEQNPFPGSVTIRIFEIDEGKSPRIGDPGEETTPDDLIAICKGQMLVHPTWQKHLENPSALKKLDKAKSSKILASRYAAIFKPDPDGVRDRQGKVIKPGSRGDLPRNRTARDLIWVKFEGMDRCQAYLLEIPSDPDENEGDFFEIGFVIEPAQAQGQKFTSKATCVRRREILLAVEPLGQGDWGTLRTGYRVHEQIVQYFHDGKWDYASRNWGNMIIRAHCLGGKSFTTMAPQGCSITCFTMLIRYLADPPASTAGFKSIYDSRIENYAFDDKYKPYRTNRETADINSKITGYEDVKIPKWWWPIRVVWYARQKGGYREIIGSGGQSLQHRYERGEKATNTWITNDGRLLDRSTDLLADLNLECATVDVQSGKAWAAQQAKIKQALDDGLPVMGLVRIKVSEKKYSAHWILMVGYLFEKDKIRFIFNNPGTNLLRQIAAGKANHIPYEPDKNKKPVRPLVTFLLIKPKDWNASKHARFINSCRPT